MTRKYPVRIAREEQERRRVAAVRMQQRDARIRELEQQIEEGQAEALRAAMVSALKSRMIDAHYTYQPTEHGGWWNGYPRPVNEIPNSGRYEVNFTLRGGDAVTAAIIDALREILH